MIKNGEKEKINRSETPVYQILDCIQKQQHKSNYLSAAAEWTSWVNDSLEMYDGPAKSVKRAQ